MVGSTPCREIISVYEDVLGYWNGDRSAYLEYHLPNGDSVVIDAVKNDIDPATGQTQVRASAVAGVPNATNTHVLIRKSNIKAGNLNWDDARGNDLDDSEWLPVPFRTPLWDYGARYFTTVGYHGDATLNKTFVDSKTVNIDFAAKKLVVPWGIYQDSLMDEFDLGGGVAWQYHYSQSIADSTYITCNNNDSITIFATGNKLEQSKFSIEVAPPTTDVAFVLPIRKKGRATNWYIPYYVTEKQPEIDSIGNVAFAERIDSLFKYLVKAPEAKWEIIWVDGVPRVDVKRGDILKVTAENGTVKQYFIDADSVPAPSHNAELAAILWPDVPEFLKESPEWREDTIPGFRQKIYSYVFTVPYGTYNVPALVASPVDKNAKIEITRAIAIKGSVEDRTTTFTVTAEDDSTIVVYSILFKDEKLPENDQPFYADPYISQVVFRQFWGSDYLEIANPGNRPLDLSRYMLTTGFSGQNPATILTGNLGTDQWLKRFIRYIPGYEWQDEANWQLQPGVTVKDFGVNPIIQPGDVFVVGRIEVGSASDEVSNKDCDIIINQWNAPKGVTYGKVVVVGDWTCLQDWWGQNRSVLIFKILNDSILDGSKPVGDVNDFQLVDIFGDYAGTQWAPGGRAINGQGFNIKRRAQYWWGDTIPNYSFGTTKEDSYWDVFNAQDYSDAGYGWPQSQWMLSDGIGAHPMIPTFVYMSTVSSNAYKVSDGFESPQEIKGIVTGAKVSDFLPNITKADAGQALKVVDGTGAEKAADAVLVDGDKLVVTSADTKNVTEYVLAVSADGLDQDAKLVANASSDYKITIDGDKGTISGFDYYTTVEEVLSKVTKPELAILNVVNDVNNLVPLYLKNFDSVRVATKVSHTIMFEVIAEDGVTKITYQLQPSVRSADDAFIHSNIYAVDQGTHVISLIPDDTRAETFFSYIYANKGATYKLMDKIGFERTTGNISFDDQLVVTSESGKTVKVYYLQFFEESTAGTEAFVTSDVLTVKQAELEISDIIKNTAVATFKTSVVPAPDANLVVVDANGNVVNSGTLGAGYKLKVTSGDGSKVVTYTLSYLVSIDKDITLPSINAYPNPTSGVVFIEGLQPGSKIIVRNITGQVVDMIDSKQAVRGTISLQNQPSGVYFLSLQVGAYSSKTVKVVKQ